VEVNGTSLFGLTQYKYQEPSMSDARAQWYACPLPVSWDFASTGTTGRLPVLCGCAIGGNLEYAWTETPFPQDKSDWHSATVVAQAARSDAVVDQQPVKSVAVFPPIPVPGPAQRLAAGAVRLPPPFALTWQLVLLAGMVVAGGASALRRLRRSIQPASPRD
jgi:hypothetical protein